MISSTVCSCNHWNAADAVSITWIVYIKTFGHVHNISSSPAVYSLIWVPNHKHIGLHQKLRCCVSALVCTTAFQTTEHFDQSNREKHSLIWVPNHQHIGLCQKSGLCIQALICTTAFQFTSVLEQQWDIGLTWSPASSRTISYCKAETEVSDLAWF